MAAFTLAASLLLSGCSLVHHITRPTRTLPPPQPAQITVANMTKMDLDLFVNGANLATVPATTGRTLVTNQLPPLPWHVEARTVSGRVIGSFEAQESDLWPRFGDHSGVEWTIAGTRVDLSCGVLKMWVGNNAISGPIPGPGTPGDCRP